MSTSTNVWGPKTALLVVSGAALFVACSGGGDGQGAGTAAEPNDAGASETSLPSPSTPSGCSDLADGASCGDALPPSCSDGTRGGDESDVDCGGSCAKCADARRCADAKDCASGFCSGGFCAAPTCTDTATNGKETDLDCGGGACPACDEGRRCVLDSDCLSKQCLSETCVVTPGITTVSPAVGPSTGGTRITIDGSNFRAGKSLAVHVGGKPASDVTWVSATKVTAITPSHPGVSTPLSVQVTNPSGAKFSLSNAFKPYLAAISFGPPKFSFDAPERAQVGDVDGDKKPDLLLSRTGQLYVRKGAGDGTFGAEVLVEQALGGDFLLTDFNADGKLDVIAVGEISRSGVWPNEVGTFGVSVLIGNGNGTFASPTRYTTSTGSVYGGFLSNAVVADFNGDGKPDVAASSASEVIVLLANGNGTLGAPLRTAVATSYLRSIYAGDIDGDGKPDLLRPRFLESVPYPRPGKPGAVYIDVFKNAGNSFGAPWTKTIPTSVDYRSADVSGFAAGSFNGDARADVLILTGPNSDGGYGGPSPTLHRLFGEVDATLSGNLSEGIAGGGSLVVADVNLDGLVDLVQNVSQARFSVRMGLGNGGFGDAVAFGAGAGGPYATLLVADVNLDGKPDLIRYGGGGYGSNYYAQNELAGLTVILNTSQ
jgi:hypothetical protein